MASELVPSSKTTGDQFVPLATGRFTIDQYAYVEEEWFAEGVENSNPYTTTVLFRLPRDRSRFSGTVVVEPLHASGIAPIWIYSSPYFMRSGHGWAMVASQKSTVEERLRTSNPERYASLEIMGAESTLGGQQRSARPTQSEWEALWADLKRRNRASSTILAQVGAAIAESGGPLDGFGVRQVILAGHSQTGNVVTEYVREAHNSERRSDGSAVYSGYFPSGYPTANAPFQKIDVPTVVLLSDGDISHPTQTIQGLPYEGRGYRRDDSDDVGDRFRLYEVAGLPHMGTRYPPFNSVELWTANAKDVIRPSSRMSSLPHNEIFNTAIHHLIGWASDGTAPPRAPRLPVGASGLFEPDEHGNTLGGIRCAQMDLPRARYYPNAPYADGTPSTATVGIEESFPQEKLAALYASDQEYARQFEARVNELVAERWLLREDVEYVLNDAEASHSAP